MRRSPSKIKSSRENFGWPCFEKLLRGGGPRSGRAPETQHSCATAGQIFQAPFGGRAICSTDGAVSFACGNGRRWRSRMRVVGKTGVAGYKDFPAGAKGRVAAPPLWRTSRPALPTATRLQHSAQRCRDEGAATLGERTKMKYNSEGVVATWRRIGCNAFSVENFGT